MAHDGEAGRALALSEAEALRVSRLKSAAQQDDLSRSLQVRRVAIAEMTGAPEGEIALGWTEDGAPLLKAPAGWSLSVSTLDGATAIALAPAGTLLGTDITRVGDIGWAPMLQMVSEPEEARAFAESFAGDGGRALPAFHRLWAIKEAVLKATGRGMRAGAKNVPVAMAWLAAPSAAFALTAFGQRFTGVCGETGGIVACVVAGMDQR